MIQSQEEDFASTYLACIAGCRCKLGGLQSVNVCMKKKRGYTVTPLFLVKVRLDYRGLISLALH